MVQTSKVSNSLQSAFVALLFVSTAIAQGVPKLDILIESEKMNKSAIEIRTDAEILFSPGDTIRYSLTASNIGNGLMTSPEVVDPIPAGVTYVAGSASGESCQITYSIDNGTAFMEWPPFYTIRNSKGVLVKRQATPEMITHIKWNIDKNLDPGEKVLMDFLVVVTN